LLTTKEAVRHMGPEGGSIINVGSGASSMRPPNCAVCTGSKAAVDAITGVVAKELGPRKIRVNSINPGMIETEGAHAAGFVGSDFQKLVETPVPAGPDGTARRHRPDGRLSGVGRLEVHDRRGALGVGRPQVGRRERAGASGDYTPR